MNKSSDEMLKNIKSQGKEAEYNHLVQRGIDQRPVINNPGKSHIPTQYDDFCQDKCLDQCKAVMEVADAQLIRHELPVRGKRAEEQGKIQENQQHVPRFVDDLFLYTGFMLISAIHNLHSFLPVWLIASLGVLGYPLASGMLKMRL